MSVADARSDLQRHGSTLRPAGSGLQISSPRRHPELRPISPDRTSIASPRPSVASLGVPSSAAGTAAALSSPRIASFQNGANAPYSSSGSLWSGAKQDSIGSPKRRYPSQIQQPAGANRQSPGHVQPAGQCPAQKRFSSVSDADQHHRQAAWQ